MRSLQVSTNDYEAPSCGCTLVRMPHLKLILFRTKKHGKDGTFSEQK